MPVVAGCSGEPAKIEPTDSIFAGLPNETVKEVIDNPKAQKNVADVKDVESRNSLWQGMVRNFIECRAAAKAYQSWKNTGQPPQLPPPPVPKTPLQPSDSDMSNFRKDMIKNIQSGDPQILKKMITGTGSCGEWIPMKPGDSSGQTIAQSIESHS
ncbi:hypothetical protein [Austwickia sp. TVS 96-490-7B]|uniref:hypothetical protein n=1 Tax=Austwickia sp. TVS 96-490-7B TaxID=2830843 RepID=UPI001C59155B|nr:hypothetical protein [Austwickia sp. TVS 96-490-7B]